MNHSTELRLLDASYRLARSVDRQTVNRLFAGMAGLPAIFVGSGGTLPLAQFAAEVHGRRSGRLALALTPLRTASGLPTIPTPLVGFSARVRNHDISFALSQAIQHRMKPVRLITHCPEHEVRRRIALPELDIVALPSVLAKDGFLATNSVVSMATVIARSAQHVDEMLPDSLNYLESEVEPIETSDCLILVGPGQLHAGMDLETRMSESGLVRAQLTDYRNFAHGRHVGFCRHMADTTIIAMVAPEYSALADSVLDLLPSSTRILRLQTELTWPASALDMLVASIKVVGATAARCGVNAAAPRVESFGRRLYHLDSRPYVRKPNDDSVGYKLTAIGVPPSETLRSFYRHALEDWFKHLANSHFQAIVLDYDGTVCTTEGRFQLPRNDVQAELLRILDCGVSIGFASGRGKSLYRDLRQWIPTHHWHRVVLGLYNGGLQLRLDDELPAPPVVPELFDELMSRLRHHPYLELVDYDVRPYQTSFRVQGAGITSADMLATWLHEAMRREPQLPLTAVASAHSVDVVPLGTSKRNVVARVAGEGQGGVLTIGDQGQVGGNDFELLAAVPTSLSVDRCSADPTRCWRLDVTGANGPDILVTYLRALTSAEIGLTLVRSRLT